MMKAQVPMVPVMISWLDAMALPIIIQPTDEPLPTGGAAVFSAIQNAVCAMASKTTMRPIQRWIRL